ncbi:MAG TPA: hypothetical protein VEM41_11955, partial [Actinomycetota bacterium]|nr:hypothetical protein [Actinomycetota bacterium]
NVYTGVANKDNPTILAWETGNEIRPPRSWTSRISAYIRSIDPRHLIEDGYAGIHRPDLDLPDVDLFSDHFYPLDTARLRSDARTVAAAHKVFVVGEYAWNDPGALPGFLAAAQSAAALGGDLYWALDGLNDDFGYEQHYDGFQVHVPGDDRDVGGSSPVVAPDSDRRLVDELRDHAFAMSGLPVPPFPVPAAPRVTSVEHLPLGNLVEWVGSAAAASYEVQRSAAGAGGPWVTVGRVHAVAGEPWLDRGAPGGADVWYRAVAINPNGVAGPPSAAFELRLRTFDDPLRSLGMAWSHSPGLSIRTGRASLFDGDASRIGSPEGAPGRIAWRVPGMRTLEAVGFYGPSPGDLPSSDVIQRRGHVSGVEGVALPRVLHFQFLVSVDGRTWKVVPSRDVTLNGGAAAAPGDWTPYVYTIDDVQEVLPGAAYAAVRWGSGSGHIAELGEVRITYAPPARSDLIFGRQPAL